MQNKSLKQQIFIVAHFSFSKRAMAFQDWAHASSLPCKTLVNDACSAVRYGDVAALRRLCKEQGVNPESIDRHGRRLLNQAALCGHLGVVQCLVDELGADVAGRSDWETKDVRHSGSTALMAAANNNNLEVVKFLVSRGAELEASVQQWSLAGYYEGITSLLMAAGKGHREVFDFLVEAGANLHATMSLRVNPAFRLDPYLSGMTALHYASFAHNSNMIRYLVAKYGLDVNARDGTTGMAPIHVGCVTGDDAALRTLAELGADINLRAVGAEGTGNAALHIAAFFGLPKVVKALVELGADPTVKNNAGQTPIELARNEATVAIIVGSAASPAALVIGDRRKGGTSSPGGPASASDAGGAVEPRTADDGEGSDSDKDEESVAGEDGLDVSLRVLRPLNPAVLRSAARRLAERMAAARLQGGRSGRTRGTADACASEDLEA